MRLIKLVEQPIRQSWRLVLPLAAIVSILVIGGSLLYASQVFERNRQEQRLISDALWAEQSVSYEVQRMLDGLRAFPTGHDAPDADAFHKRSRAVLQRNPAIVSIYRWGQPADAFPPAPDRTISVQRIHEAASRASRLRHPITLEVRPDIKAASDVLLAVPNDVTSGDVVVAVVSLERLLHNTIPWWLAHSTQITLEDTSGSILAKRDANVKGRGVYTHKIATPFVDRTLYLDANSTQSTPFLVPNLLALSVAALSLLLAWTVYALWSDLAKRIKTEAALRAQQALQTAMENSLVTGLRARDMRGRITYANPAFCEMVGYSLEQIVEMRPPMKYWAPTARESAQARHERLLAGSVPDKPYETRFIKPNGETLDVLMHEAPLLDGSGTQIGWMASVQNISEQKRNAELLREQADRIQKMSRLMTMGEMASALAHELNQPLAAATSYISAGLNMVEDPADRNDAIEAVSYFRKAKTQTDRAGEIIRRVRQFVGHSAPILAPLKVGDIVLDLMPLIKLQPIDADTRIATDLAEHLPPVMADRVLLEQIILNLTKNAFEAMTHLPPSQKQVQIFCEALDPVRPREVRVGVRDRGEGLGDQSARVMSNSFASTKPGGLGMGLAVCRSALELMGSRLSYQEAPGGGAEFHFVLHAASARR